MVRIEGLHGVGSGREVGGAYIFLKKKKNSR